MIFSFLQPIVNFFVSKAVLLLAGAFVSLLLIFGTYHWYASDKIENLTQANAQMMSAIERQEKSIEELVKTNDALKRANAAVRVREGQIRTRAANLQSQLQKIFRPDASIESIEKEIAKVEADRLRCIEIITNSTVVESDKANTLCPEFVLLPSKKE